MTRKSKTQVALEEANAAAAKERVLRANWLNMVMEVLEDVSKESDLELKVQPGSVFLVRNPNTGDFWQLPATLPPVGAVWMFEVRLTSLQDELTERRVEREAAELRAELRKTALSKLSPAEREALGY